MKGVKDEKKTPEKTYMKLNYESNIFRKGNSSSKVGGDMYGYVICWFPTG